MTAGENTKRDRFMISPYLRSSDDAPCISAHRPAGSAAGFDRLRSRSGIERTDRAINLVDALSDRDRFCYREGWLELLLDLLLTFEPVVVESESMTISVTSLVSGSINMIRSGSFTNS